MSHFLLDARYGIRSLLSRPAFTAIAVLTLALGIGANTAIFSAVNAVLLRDLPFEAPDRLAMVWLDNSRLGVRQDITSYPNFLDWRDNEVFEEMAAFTTRRHHLTGEAEPEQVRVAHVLPGFFGLLGVSPQTGRSFLDEEAEPGAARVVLLSQGLWQRRYGADPDLVGRTIPLDGEEHLVVGVLPAGFDFPEVQMWAPLVLGEDAREARYQFWLFTVGRLKDGVSLDRAQTAMSAVAGRLAMEHEGMAGFGIYVQPLREYLVGDVGPALLVLLTAVAAVLLIACANVANLLLVRAASREREIAIRAALGAGRGRMLRQLLTESVLLSVTGGLLGLLLAVWGVDLLLKLSPPGLADELPASGLALDGRVLLFTLAVSLGTALIAGLLPAFQASKTNLTSSLKEGGRGLAGGRRGRRIRQGLVVAEIAAALVLLIAAGLLVRSFLSLQNVDPGLRREGVLIADLDLPRASYGESAQVLRFYRSLRERIAGLPGVEDVAAGRQVLLPELTNSGAVTIEGRPDPPEEERIEVAFDAVTPGFFRVLGVPLLQGRDVAETDDDSGPEVAVINQAMASRYWPGESPLGRRFQFGDEEEVEDDGWITVIGVVANARRTALDREARPSIFIPHPLFAMRRMSVVVRTPGDPLAVADAVRRQVHELDHDLPIGRVTTLSALIDERVAPRRFHSLLLGLFSALALVLALVGIYGVLSYMVSESLQEIGIRMALGARAQQVMGWVMARGLALVALGVALGVGGALLATRLLAGFLYGVTPWDPWTYAALAGLLVAATAVAAWMPAYRAARVDPLQVLRAE